MINPRSFPAAILTSTPPISSALRYWKARRARSEEHTSELQSRSDLVCRLLLEKKKKHVLPVFSSLVCPKYLGPHRGFSCHCFPSLVERRDLCRYTNGTSGVVGIAPVTICVPSC